MGQWPSSSPTTRCARPISRCDPRGAPRGGRGRPHRDPPRPRRHPTRSRRARPTTRSSGRASSTPRTGSSRWTTIAGGPTGAGRSSWARSGVEADRLARRFRLRTERAARLGARVARRRAPCSPPSRPASTPSSRARPTGASSSDHRDAARTLAALGQHGRVQDPPPRHGAVESQALARAAAAPPRPRARGAVSRARRSLIRC